MNPNSKLNHLRRLCLASGWFAASLQHQERELDLKELAKFLEISVRTARKITKELVKLNIIWRDYGDILRDENGIITGRENSRYQFGAAAKPIESPNGRQKANFVKKGKNDLRERPIYAEGKASVDKANKQGEASSYVIALTNYISNEPEFKKMLKHYLTWLKQNPPNIQLKNSPIFEKSFKNLTKRSNATADQEWFAELF